MATSLAPLMYPRADAAPPERVARTTKVVAGQQYAVPPGGQTWVLGENYRKLWATPIEVEILDLETEASGLSPVRRVGGKQTLGLALRGEDGRAYTFRSVDKDLTHVLPWYLQIDTVAEVAQDQMSATVPGAEVAAYPFAHALGLIESEARLVVMPDDPRLGEFQSDFAGRLGLFLEFPTPGYLGTTEIQSASEFWERRQADPHNRADPRTFLKARLLDLFLGDWDRHRGQWRWARVPGKPWLQPVPEDRDQVFCDFGGFAMSIARANGIPLVTYDEAYVDLLSGTQNGWDLDRFILTDIDRAEWMALAEEVRAELTDEVIEEGLRRLPPEYFDLVGESLRAKLEARRDRIVPLAETFYDYLSHKVDVQGSDGDDVVTIEPLRRGAVAVRVALVGDASPYYERVFLRDETTEVRLYLHGGDDRITSMRSRGGLPRIHVVAGPGDDVLENDGRLDFWDFEGTNQISGEGRTKRHPRAYEDPALKEENENVPWVPSKDWGRITSPRAVFGYHADAGVLVGGGVERIGYGFRTYPWASRNTLTGAFAVGVNRPLIDYKGDFRSAARGVHLALESRFSGLDQLRYYGLGNESDNDGGSDPYAIELYQLTLFPAIAYGRGAKGSVLVGPVFKFSDSGGTGEDTVLATERPVGFGRVSQLGARADVRYNSRTEGDVFASGLELRARGTFYPELWDIERDFGWLDARVDFHHPLGSRVFLSLAAGGRKIWGDEFPFYEAAYIGGHRTTEGYNWNRFAGDASFYGLADVKWIFRELKKVLPGELGISLQVDTGRVWLEGEESSVWHPSYGAGVFYAPFSRFALFEAGIGRSSERTFFIVRAQAKFLEF